MAGSCHTYGIAIDEGDTMHWQTHTVFNQPTLLNNSNLFRPIPLCVKQWSEAPADGDLLAALASSWDTPNRWSWDARQQQSADC